MAQVQEVVGANPAVYWMDVSDASYYIHIEKINNEGSQMGHTKKNYYYYYHYLQYSSIVIWDYDYQKINTQGAPLILSLPPVCTFVF
jgi:hypothetical protein